MKQFKKIIISSILTVIFLVGMMAVPYRTCFGKEELEMESPSVVLMELSSGQILYEKNPDEARRPASVTKIMTMLLVFDAIQDGKLSLDDEIVVSAHAASMGGSQVYLEEGEVQSLEDLLKCMIVSSANDAAVAVSEAVTGSEEAFVQMMNDRAKELGMEHTHFENVCGLEAKDHMMSAKDVALLSRELILTHPEVFDYTTIWMDTIIHKTAKGESEFGLANTNKFLKKYEGANGLKTGYTSDAGFSMSATATKNGMTLIAVVMGSTTKEIRYEDARKLLDYGFANCELYQDANVLGEQNQVSIKNAAQNPVSVYAQSKFHYVMTDGTDTTKIIKKLNLDKKQAPLKKDETVGYMEYFYQDKMIGKVAIKTTDAVEEEKFPNVFLSILYQYTNMY